MPEPIMVDGQRLFRVDVTETRTATIYVLADDQAAAEQDAKVLGSELDEWDDVDSDIDTIPARKAPRPEDVVWVGGEKGSYREWETFVDDAG